MRNWLRPVPGLGPTPAGRVGSFCKVKEIKGLCGTARKCGAEEIPQIDTEIAEKGYLWMETSVLSQNYFYIQKQSFSTLKVENS